MHRVIDTEQWPGDEYEVRVRRHQSPRKKPRTCLLANALDASDEASTVVIASKEHIR
jgi:hypothetical protein